MTTNLGAPVNILLIEDNPGDVRLTREALAVHIGGQVHRRVLGRHCHHAARRRRNVGPGRRESCRGRAR